MPPQSAVFQARFSLSAADSGGDSEPGSEVTTAINVGDANSVSTTVVVFALATGSLNVAIFGSNNLSVWTHLGDIADISTVGSTIGQVANVSTRYIRARATLTAEVGKSAQCIVSVRLRLSSL